MVAKKTAVKKTNTTDSNPADKHWFPEEAKAPTAATAPVKKASPWQRRAIPVNYGTLAKPGISLKEIFNQHLDEKHKKLSNMQRDAVWKVVGMKMLSEPLNRLKEITDTEVKAHIGSK
jgi:hypothetical protein